MNTNTAIAVAAAVIVVAVIFIVPGLSPFSFLGSAAAPAQTSAAATATGQTAAQATSQTSTTAQAPTTMDVSNIPQNVTQLLSKDDVVGTGDVAAAGDSVTVNYVGALSDGKVFDASANHGQPFTFTLGAGQVIKGWDEGVAGMKVGGTRTLVIPASLGYGATGAGGVIPPNATLIFQVQLVSVTPPAAH